MGMMPLTEAEIAEIAEYVAEWRTTCRLLGVAYTPQSIAEWLSNSEVIPRIVAARVSEAVS
jgi:hypothetical protein